MPRTEVESWTRLAQIADALPCAEGQRAEDDAVDNLRYADVEQHRGTPGLRSNERAKPGCHGEDRQPYQQALQWQMMPRCERAANPKQRHHDHPGGQGIQQYTCRSL